MACRVAINVAGKHGVAWHQPRRDILLSVASRAWWATAGPVAYPEHVHLLRTRVTSLMQICVGSDWPLVVRSADPLPQINRAKHAVFEPYTTSNPSVLTRFLAPG